jgi:hypothetical protein
MTMLENASSKLLLLMMTAGNYCITVSPVRAHYIASAWTAWKTPLRTIILSSLAVA